MKKAGQEKRWIRMSAFAFLLGTSLSAQPSFNSSGPEASTFGAGQKFPVGDRHTWLSPKFLVGSFSRYDTIFPSQRVAPAPHPWKFKRAAVEPEISYEFGGRRQSLADYLGHFPVTGLLLLQGDTILFERYQYGRTESDRFMSASMAKSVVSLLAGVALADGRIQSLDDPAARYVPELAGTPYGETPLRALLQMSSGIEVDVAGGDRKDSRTEKLIDGIFTPGANPVAVLAECRRRIAPPDTHFQYSSGDTEMVGLIVRRVTGNSLTAYLSEKLWSPMGAEAAATWWADTSGQEMPFSGFNAVLRDYARLGRLLAHEGEWNGRQLIPKSYLIAATTNRAGDRHLVPGAATPYYGYGFQFWIFPGERRMFVLRGAQSQYVFVDPASKLVLVQTAVRSEGPDSENGKSECLALWLALVKQFGGAQSAFPILTP
jgi:CubicO group peptidase (beta-lactamase class C family)